MNLCKKYHVLKGENSKEPDVRICLDNIKPPCNVISVGIAYNFIFDYMRIIYVKTNVYRTKTINKSVQL